MAERSSWSDVRRRRMREPGAEHSYQAVHRAHELGRKVRDLREQREWSQTALARAAGMTQPALARFESGGTVPTLPALERLAGALDVNLVVHLTSRTDVSLIQAPRASTSFLRFQRRGDWTSETVSGDLSAFSRSKISCRREFATGSKLQSVEQLRSAWAR